VTAHNCNNITCEKYCQKRQAYSTDTFRKSIADIDARAFDNDSDKERLQ